MAGEVRPPAEVEVVTEKWQPGVESAERIPDVAADERPRRTDGKDIADGVVLTLVELPAFQAGLPSPGRVDGVADLHDDPGVVPGVHLRSDHRDRRAGVTKRQQLPQRFRSWCTVVGKQPDPLDRLCITVARHRSLGGTGVGVEGERDGGAEPRRAGRLENRTRTEFTIEDAAGVIDASGVDGDDALRRATLPLERSKGFGQPGRAVVRDEYGGHQVPRKFEGNRPGRWPTGLLGGRAGSHALAAPLVGRAPSGARNGQRRRQTACCRTGVRADGSVPATASA